MDSIKVSKVHNVALFSRTSGKEEIKGVLSITLTHLIFQEFLRSPEFDGNSQSSDSGSIGKPSKEFMIAMSLISKVDRVNGVAKVIVFTKHFRVYEFKMPKESDAYNVQISLTALAAPAKLTDLYAFMFKKSSETIGHSESLSSSSGINRSINYQQLGSEIAAPSSTECYSDNNWGAHSIATEYVRMRVNESKNWKIDLELNSDYQLSDSYPSQLVFPFTAKRPTIEGSAKFRSRGRLPTLTYLHQNGAAICRSSQPLVGMTRLAGARSNEDEELCHMIAKNSPGKKQLFIIDTRPKVNAWANKMQGKGYETDEFYPFIKFEFANIENVHVMRSSLAKIIECCDKKPSSVTVSAYLSEIVRSGWLKHLRAILEASVRVVGVICEERQNVLVHCSDGWDRTSQVCSIASLLLDPFYRTFNGLIALIEKDWLAFGHKFVDRCGFIEGDYREVSPIFTQFLDVIWQLQSQFPTYFEYNERLLIEIHTELYQCKYGTFLGNNERERREHKLSETTTSLWKHLKENHRFFINPFFNPQSAPQVLQPSLNPDCFKLWAKMYNLWESSGAITLEPIITKINNHNFYLIDHVKLLQKKLTDLRRMVYDEGDSVDLTDSTEVLFRDLGISSDVYDIKTFEGEARSPPRSTFPPDLSLPSTLTSSSNGVSELDVDSGFEIVSSEEIADSSYAEYMAANFEGGDASALKCSLSWQDFSDIRSCYNCATNLEPICSKVHCISCGKVFCGGVSCIEYTRMDNVLYSKRRAPVCKRCIEAASSESTEDSFQRSRSNTISIIPNNTSSHSLMQFPLG